MGRYRQIQASGLVTLEAILSFMDIAGRIRQALVDRTDVRLAYLFGSTAAGMARRGSDADIAILFDELPASAVLDLLSERLEEVAERPVDLVVLNAAPPLLAREVVARGCLLVCRNDRGGGRELPALVSRAAERAGIPLAAVSEAGPGADFPRLPGFPEGDPFEGLLVERAQG